MNPDEIKQHLRGQEKEIYQSYLDYLSNLDEHPERSQAFTDAISVAKTFLERLAEERKLSEQRRALMVKHQFDSLGLGVHRCRECKAAPIWYSEDEFPPCKPDCLWAKAIEKGE